MIRAVIRAASAILVAVGFISLASLVASDMCAQQRADANITSMTARLDESDSLELQAIEQQARRYNAALAGVSTSQDIWPYPSQLSYRGEPMMGYVEIPSIAVKLPIYHGTGEAELMSGVGHLEGSSLPVGGASTRCVLLGHTGMSDTRMFDDLVRLEAGDVFVIWSLNVAHAYEVFQVQVMLPDEVPDALAIEPGADLATLVTCTPYGVNSHRLLVNARRCSYEPDDEPAFAPVLRVGARSVPLLAASALLACAVIASAARHVQARRGRRRQSGLPGRHAKGFSHTKAPLHGRQNGATYESAE